MELTPSKIRDDSYKIIELIKKNSNADLGILYNRLASDYMKIRENTISWPKVDLNQLKSEMHYLRDFDEFKRNGFEIGELCIEIEKKYPIDSFIELSNRINGYTYNLDFNGIYYTLRELSDRLFPILLVNSLVKMQKLETRFAISLYIIYLNYLITKFWNVKTQKIKKINLEKNKDLKDFSNKFFCNIKSKKLLKKDGSVNFDNLNNVLNDSSFNLPIANISSNGLKTVITGFGGSDCSKTFKRLYEISSSSVHKVLSLPLPSVLELKVAKMFLKTYRDCLKNILKTTNIITENFEYKYNMDRIFCHRLTNLIDLIEKNKNTVENYLKNNNYNNYTFISNLFDIYGVGISNIKNNQVNYMNFREFISHLNDINYNPQLAFIEKIFQEVGNELKNLISGFDPKNVLSKFEPEEIGYISLYIFSILAKINNKIIINLN